MQQPHSNRRASKKEQSLDILSTLEHLMVMGCKARQDQDIVRRFINEQYTQHQKDQDCVSNEHSEDELDIPNRIPLSTETQLFLEDNMIYGDLISVGKGFKKTFSESDQYIQSFADCDDQWDVWHGDNIHPFDMHACLPRAATVEDSKVSSAREACVQRFWGRAVQIASSSQWVKVPGAGLGGSSSSDANADQQPESQELGVLGLLGSTPVPPPSTEIHPRMLPSLVVQNQKTQDSFDATVTKCKSLRIELMNDGSKQTFECPVCIRAFSSFTELEKHYYGGNGEVGCCWRKITKKYREDVSRLLEAYLDSQIDSLLSLILATSQRNMKQQAKSENRKRKRLNWQDIVHQLDLPQLNDESRQSVDSTAKSTSHPVLKSVRTEHAPTSCMLNDMIMRSVRQRLILRYSP